MAHRKSSCHSGFSILILLYRQDLAKALAALARLFHAPNHQTAPTFVLCRRFGQVRSDEGGDAESASFSNRLRERMGGKKAVIVRLGGAVFAGKRGEGLLHGIEERANQLRFKFARRLEAAPARSVRRGEQRGNAGQRGLKAGTHIRSPLSSSLHSPPLRSPRVRPRARPPP